MPLHFACCSDTHDRVPPNLPLPGIAAWLHAGDWYEGPNHALVADAEPDDWLLNHWQQKTGRALQDWAVGQPIPIFTVNGNHDTGDFWNIFEKFQIVGGRLIPLADHLFLAGIGWHGKKYFDTPAETDLQPICQNLLRQAARLMGSSDSLILLTHYPARIPNLFPWRASTKSPGFDCVRSLIEQLAPVAAVQGHVHEWFGTTARFPDPTGRTLLINPGPQGAILSINTKTHTATCPL